MSTRHGVRTHIFRDARILTRNRILKWDGDTKHYDNKQKNMADTVANNSKKYVNK
jgi:hypothetical protein